jgi:hypothetical protein
VESPEALALGGWRGERRRRCMSFRESRRGDQALSGASI